MSGNISTASAPDSATEAAQRAENHGSELNGVIWFLTAISSLFLALRIYAKLFRGRKLWWDDYVLTAGWLALATSCVFQSLCVSLGLGRHGRYIKPSELSSLLFFSYLAGFFSILAAAWTKSSFAITLLSFSEGRTRKFVWFILISVNIVLGLNATLQWVQCWPVHKLWLGGPGHCWLGFARSRIYNTFVAVYSGTADIVLALLPWKIIWHAKIRKIEKRGALFAMSMGVFAGTTSIAKVATLYAIGNKDMITMVTLFMLATAEGAITIIAASIPIFRPLFHKPKAPSTPPRPSQLEVDFTPLQTETSIGRPSKS